MDKDRTEICNIISHMLDNPDKHGIFPTSTANTILRELGWRQLDGPMLRLV